MHSKQDSTAGRTDRSEALGLLPQGRRLTIRAERHSITGASLSEGYK